MKQLPIIADVHMHTFHSHGQASTKDMYQACIAAGLKIIGFSEHSPRPEGYTYPKSDYQEKLNKVFPTYIKEVLELKEQGKVDGVRVLLGLELDYIRDEENFAKAECAKYPYDYIIGGLHFQGKWGFDGGEESWSNFDQKAKFAIYRRYYEDMISMCNTGLFHIVAHPDLIKIYTLEDFNLWLEMPESLSLVEMALCAIKHNSMAMEISSAGLRKKCQEIYPGKKIMALAQKLNVPISFGADSHCANTPAFGYDTLARYASSFGYSSSLVFYDKKPQEVAFTTPGIF